MKPLPVRWRVAWWSAIATGTALLAFATGTLVNLFHEQMEEVDLKLAGAARRLTEANEGTQEGGVSHEAREMEYEPWLAAAVFARDGRLLVDSRRVPEAVARAAQDFTKPTTIRMQQRDWRVLAVRGPEQVLILAFDLEELNDIIADLLAGYLIVLPLAAGIAALGGWIVAGRALRPVRAATAAAARIAPGRLDQRLPVPPVQDEIADLTRVINAMLARMEASFRQAERFAADASHEIRTPLTIIKGEVESALGSPDLARPIEARLLSVQEEITRLQRVTEQLLLLARLDSGFVPVERAPVDLSALVREACDDVELIASTRDVAIDLTVTDDIVVSGGEELLRRVVLNLLDNASKFNEPGGRITCSLQRENECVVLQVANTGPGIPAELQDHLFQRFFRADAARSRGGHGLGLSLSREIVQAHGGTLELVRGGEPGLTEFRVVLPFHEGGRATSSSAE